MNVWTDPIKPPTPEQQMQWYDQCHCNENLQVSQSILEQTKNRACMINNSAFDKVTGLSYCEMTARFRMCPVIGNVPCKSPFRKIDKRCTGPLTCKAGEENSDGHCCPKGQKWSAQLKKCASTTCPAGQKMVNGKCVADACPKFQKRVNGKCVNRCAKGTSLYPQKDSVGCAHDCPKGQHVENGKCTPNWVGCRTLDECKKYYMDKIKAARTRKMTAQEALRAFNTKDHRRLQAPVPKQSQESLEDTLADATKEYDFFKSQFGKYFRIFHVICLE